MQKYRNNVSLAFGVALGFQAASASAAMAGDSGLTHYENSFQGRTYHHVVLQLAPDLFSNDEAHRDPEIGHRFSDGGLFEIYMKPKAFGPAAGHCKVVKVRMPWTDPAAADSAGKVAGKKDLFEEIEKLRRGDSAGMRLVLQLDPYLSVEPSGDYRLTHCLVFFRTAFGAYVDHPYPITAPGQIRKTD